jgi:CheY-like chemotaxis protein
MINARTSFARPSRLLIVDDDASSRDGLVKLLDIYERKVAASGEEALALVARDPPDLILLDVMMPGIDGFEVCRRLKDNDATRFIPIVIMTGLDDVEDRIRGIEAGADDFLTKPIDYRQLMARIRTALRAKHSFDRKLDLAGAAAHRERDDHARGSIRACSKCGAVFSADVPVCSLDGTRLDYFERDPLIGRRIDRYVILDRLGHGGMGCVYLASHATLKRQRYAIKIPFGELAPQRQYAERFLREAEACAGLDHPNIVLVLDFGATPEGLNYMVMEYIAGKTLRAILHEGGPLPFERAAPIARQVASGLAHAHAHGLIHRDVKPANVMVTEHEGALVAKLLDFGVALTASQSERGEPLTASGVRVGTPLYMAPEQLLGGEVGPAADLYSLGVTLYEMITGKPPFEDGKVAMGKLAKPPSPPASDTGLEPITSSLLAQRPEDRPPSARAVIEAIDALVEERGGIHSSRRAGSVPEVQRG